MGPGQVEHEYIPPYFIDPEFTKTLSEAKNKYWDGRIWGLEEFNPVGEIHSNDATTSLTNGGQMIVHNRETRRRRPKALNIFTKATQSIKKERLRNAKQRRIRAVAKARKARKARYSEVS